MSFANYLVNRGTTSFVVPDAHIVFLFAVSRTISPDSVSQVHVVSRVKEFFSSRDTGDSFTFLGSVVGVLLSLRLCSRGFVGVQILTGHEGSVLEGFTIEFCSYVDGLSLTFARRARGYGVSVTIARTFNGVNRGTKDILVGRGRYAMLTYGICLCIVSVCGASLTSSGKFTTCNRFLTFFVFRTSVCNIQVGVYFLLV